MLQLIFNKMLNKKLMMFSLFLGNLLFITIAVINPVFIQATLRHSLNSAIETKAENLGRWPMTYTIKPASYYKPEVLNVTTEELKETAEDFGMPLYDLVIYYTQKPTETVSDYEREDRETALLVSTITDLPNHIEIISGTGLKNAPDESGIIDAVVSEKTYNASRLLLGEVLTFTEIETAPGVPLKVRVAGIFKNNAEQDPYWVTSPSGYSQQLFIDDSLYTSLFLSTEEGKTVFKSRAAWYALYDYTDIAIERIPGVLKNIEYYDDLFVVEYGSSHDCSFTSLYEDYLTTRRNTQVIFIVLQVPVFLLLISFILMVSRQLTTMEAAEIAIIKSRGAGKDQIFRVYLLQDLFILSAAVLLSFPCAFLLVKAMGATTGFLQFSNQSVLVPRASWAMLLYALGAAFISLVIMLQPVRKNAGTTIVKHRAKKYRNTAVPLWQTYFIDVITLLLALYGLYSYSNQKEVVLSNILAGKIPDPLIFLCSSLFMLGAGLLTLRLSGYVNTFIYKITEKKLGPALYSSFLYILRTRRQQNYFMVFMVITIALGLFNASAARTINENDENNTRYLMGCDMIVREVWKNNSGSEDVQKNGGLLVYQEPDFAKYESIDGVEKTAQVYRSDDLTVTSGDRKLKNVEIMGIRSKDFGETAEFDTSLLDTHWYNYLNLLAEDPSGVLLSSAFQTEYGLEVGDPVTAKTESGKSFHGTVLGFVDYWPGYAPYCYRVQSDGSLRSEENLIVIADLYSLQEACGLLPYEVWIRTDGENEAVTQAIADQKIRATVDDTEKILSRRNTSSLINTTNSVLSLSFIICMILCVTGFMIFWVLSIRERELQFGILCAMGMTMNEILLVLANEQFFISVIPILLGALTGGLSAILYVPVIQLVYSSADYVIPLRVVFAGGDLLKLFIIVGLVLAVCLSVLVYMIRKLKIAQALKLGED